MTFQPGRSGNPKGGHNPIERPLRDALRMEIASNEMGDPVEVKPGSYRDLARVMINKALTGDVGAWTELANRIDGKVPTPIESDGEEGFDALKVIWLTGLRQGMFMSRMGTESHSAPYTNGHNGGLLSSPTVEPEKP